MIGVIDSLGVRKPNTLSRSLQIYARHAGDATTRLRTLPFDFDFVSKNDSVFG